MQLDGVASSPEMAASFAADWQLAQSMVPEPAALLLFASPLLHRRCRR